MKEKNDQYLKAKKGEGISTSAERNAGNTNPDLIHATFVVS